MQKIRIIPRLDIKGPNLVKGIHLEGLRVLGSPELFCEHYYSSGADEIIYSDCVASLFERNSLNDIITRTAEKTFIPLTVAGGLRSVEDIRDVLNAGADKISINTAAIKSPNLIKDASELFGSSTIVVTIEAIKQSDGKYFAFIDNGREETGLDVFDWCKQVAELGAGEILITSVDKEGTGEGFDIELIKGVTGRVTIPVIAHGGASTVEDVVHMVKETNISGVSIASALHYDYLNSGAALRDVETSSEGNTRFLKSGLSYRKDGTFDIAALKHALKQNGIETRKV
jgi:cyclase